MPAGTVLAFDYGVKRIGVAVGETALGIASPIGAIDEESNSARFAHIAKLVSEWRPAAFVVGRPRHSDGSAHEVARLAEKFARRLVARHRLPVVFVDETLSSAAAEQALREGRTRARRPGDVDAMAATIILQSYLDDPAAHERLPS
ncbi:MAG TPA: Holliday junction resolvase RuvX [Usitatibacter sp.]|nr:Holliday junction resolvase RuvX [Usitatibacter sp.]